MKIFSSYKDKSSMLDWIRRISFFLALYFMIAALVGVYWSSTPTTFDVVEKAANYTAAKDCSIVTGSKMTASLVAVMETLLQKPGGFLHNDLFPPGVWLDNVPNWEYGVLIQSRDHARALREAFSRSQSQSTEDRDLAFAEPRFNFQSKSWLLPASESEYAEGISYALRYLCRLSKTDPDGSQFYARADNLRYWLANVETRLGSLSQRLSASVGQRRLNTDLAGDSQAKQSTAGPAEVSVRTPWNQIDDIFYESRGAAWALIHFLRAAELDFEDVLEKKNATVSLKQIIRELEATQAPIWSPMIFNGTGFGMMANHSLVMASYISRANAGIIDLRELLSQG